MINIRDPQNLNSKPYGFNILIVWQATLEYYYNPR